MINAPEFLEELKAQGVTTFYGVPDSLLKGFCAVVANDNTVEHIIAANEGGAVALGAGYHLATGKIPLVYLQNSGFGNCINPLLSLADEAVYQIPMILLVGWRGEPGIDDEPQHKKQGMVTTALLETVNIPYQVLNAKSDNWKEVLRWAITTAQERSQPVALVAQKGTFSVGEKGPAVESGLILTREEAINAVLSTLPTSTIYIGSTGEISRELYELRVRRGEDPGKDFLTVGSMGHSSQIALGIARQTNNRTVCVLDGDGGSLMHLGALAIDGCHGPHNFLHIVLNNGAHGSVGGQATVGFKIDFPGIARACGYHRAETVRQKEQLAELLEKLCVEQGPNFVEIQVKLGARSDLGRPKTSPVENKQSFVKGIR